MIVHFIILWFTVALLIVLVMFLVNSIGYIYYHRMEMVWYVQMMIALVLSLFILGGIVLIAVSYTHLDVYKRQVLPLLFVT